MKTALVLGGGGARGLAHIGVLKALEEEKIPIDLIVGCSAGALLGAMYAQTPNANLVERKLISYITREGDKDLGFNFLRRHKPSSDDYLQQFFRSVQQRVFLNLFANKMSILKKERLEHTVKYLIKPGSIQDTKIPFACNATDLVSGKPVLITEGDIHTAICASSAIPGYFPPVEINGKKLVDGAVTYNLPIKFAQALGAEFVIAVDVHSQISHETDFRNLFDVILRSSAIAGSLLTEETAHYADIVISPTVTSFQWFDFMEYKKLIRAGQEAMWLHMDEIKSRLGKIEKTKMGFRRFFRLRMLMGS